MTIREKIGQMIVCGFDGHAVSDELRDALRTGTVGGIILFSRNCDSADQVIGLTEELRRAAGHKPLWVMVDQENGIVSPLSRVTTFPPGQMGLAAAGSESDVYWAARITGEKLRMLGFDAVLSPVLDVNVEPANPIIGTRAFSDDPNVVSRYGIAMMRGSIDSGVMPVGKHFPGHGATTADSHEELPRVLITREELFERELYPFRQAIQHGLPAVMVGHLFFPGVDSEEGPSSVSRKLIEGLLRNELSFGGLIVSDAMEMKGITDHYETGDAAVAAVGAGMDVLLYVDVRNAVAAHEALVDATSSGAISESRVTESYERIMVAKKSFAGIPSRPCGVDVNRILEQEFETKIRSLNRHSIMTRRGAGRGVPRGSRLLDETRPITLIATASTRRELERRKGFWLEMEPLTAERGLTTVQMNGEDLLGDGAALRRVVAEKTQVVFLSFSRTAPDRQLTELVRDAVPQSKRVLVVAVDNPWVAEHVPGGSDVAFCFGLEFSAIGVLLETMLTELPSHARMPVRISPP